MSDSKDLEFLKNRNFKISKEINRRDVLKNFGLITASLSSIISGCKSELSKETSTDILEEKIDPDIYFPFSVASGDPTESSVIIWSKLGRSTNDFKHISLTPIPITWYFYDDPELQNLIYQGKYNTDPQLSHSIHIDVRNLEPNRSYWYQFRVGQCFSPVGRTKTLPAKTTDIESCQFSIVSCQHWEMGYFNSYDGMDCDELSFVLHLGDYIYENNRGGVRTHGTTEKLITLDDYRKRHALYKTDKSLQKAHENIPFFVTLDNHDALYFNTQDPELLSIRKAAYQAWYEFQPVRYAPKDSSLLIRRNIDIGSLAKIILLDTRQFKDSEEVCSQETDKNFAFGVFQKYCPSVEEYNRYILGYDQGRWLMDQMKSSDAQWNIIASSVMMTKFDMKHNQQLYQYLQSWDGYPAQRNEILKFIKDNLISNPICISGDIHSSLVSYIKDHDTNEIIMPEFVGTSISSIWPNELALPMIDALGNNPHVQYFEHLKRGYMHCTITKEHLNITMKYVDTALVKNGKIIEAINFQVKDGSPKIYRKL